MHLFFTKVVLLVLATSAVADDRCTGNAFVSEPPEAGALPSTPACHTQWDNGEVIVGAEAWAAKFQVKAIRFKYSKMGWGEVHGLIDDFIDYHDLAEWSSTDELSKLIISNGSHEFLDQ